MLDSISVLGAGSWGTAVAILAAKNGYQTLLWGHRSAHISTLSKNRENKQYLPGLTLPNNLSVTDSLEEAAQFSSLILLSVPSHAFSDTLVKLKPFTRKNTKIIWASKGFNTVNGPLLNQTVEHIFSKTIETAVISGPSFANEVAMGLPTAITIASASPNLADNLAHILHNQYFRTYTSHDIIGVQVGGAVKNVLAIAAGIADGLGFGANTRAALITRGLQEIIRLGTKLGGQLETFMGLAGLGDLILTCTDNQSRNRRLGLALGQGKTKTEAIKEIAQEIEGIAAAKETFLLATMYHIDMPIIEQTYQVLYENLDPRMAVHNLLARTPKAESYESAK